MKKLGILLFPLLLSSCNFGGLVPSTTPKYTNDDLSSVDISSIPSDYNITEGETYYTDKKLELVVEVNGFYTALEYFTLDKENSNLRIYDNVYFYKYDFFQMMPEESDPNIYASLEKGVDKKYVEEYKSEGVDIQINVLVTGIYRLAFDLESMKFDVEHKGEITEPKYFTIETAEMATLENGGKNVVHTPMTLEGDEFKIKNFALSSKMTLSFYNINHVSWYKVTLAESLENRLAYFFVKDEKRHNQSFKMMVGGNYNISINRHTYEVNLELLNPETADYVVQYYDSESGKLAPLSPKDPSKTYLFEFVETATKDISVVSYFYNAASEKISWDIINETLLLKTNDMVFYRKAGKYRLTLNLLDLTLDAEVIE